MVGTSVRNKKNDRKGSLTTSEVGVMFNFSGGNDNGNMLVGQGFITFSGNRVAIIQNEVHDCDFSVLQVVEGGTPTTVCLFEEFDFL